MASSKRGKREMLKIASFLPTLSGSLAVPAVLCAAIATAQTPPAPARGTVPVRPAVQQVTAAPVSDSDFAMTQDQLIKLLRLSPTLTTVVSRDPSLLANADYVNRNNPQLAQFLATHPEVARNPDFYLFTHVHSEDGGPDQALERAVWPELVQPRNDAWSANDVIGPVASLLAFACFLVALVWFVRQFLENRRWGRIFKLQSEVHGRLIDKFSSNQELAGYMGTEAGKRFLEAAPIPVGFESEHRMPNAVARVLTPLQIGIVLVLLGVGFFLLRHVRREMYEPMLILGTVALMPGLGFIISAVITWVLAGRLGLIPDSSDASNRLTPTHFGTGTRSGDNQ
jgi:hypothetical protein